MPGDISGGFTGWLLNLFGNNLLDAVKQQGQDPREIVRNTFNADALLGSQLNGLLVADRTPAIFRPPGFQLAYTSVDIHSSGIVIHGSLAVLDWPSTPEVVAIGVNVMNSSPLPDWPPAHVEFEEIPTGTGAGVRGGLIPMGPDYTALKSWIPGGTIRRFEWSHPGEIQPHTDENRFVLLHQQPALADATPSSPRVSPFAPLCLTVRGDRVAAAGPPTLQPVSGSLCGYTSFHLPEGLKAGLDGDAPLMALAYPGLGGLVAVSGHTAPTLRSGNVVPNLLVHFGDERTAGNLQFLVDALQQCGRADATTGVIAVLTAEQLQKTRYAPGVALADERGRSWEKLFQVKASRPLTLIVLPSGKIAWQEEGEIQPAALAAALKKHLLRNGAVRLGVLRTNVRIGQPPPNFLFEYAPGSQLTLGKLAGRAATLVFWKCASRPSIEAVRDLQSGETTSRQSPMLLAINDGDDPDVARKSAANNGLTATIVIDPRREIAAAYGVNIWPTVIFVDALGSVRSIRYAQIVEQEVAKGKAL